MKVSDTENPADSEKPVTKWTTTQDIFERKVGAGVGKS